MMMTFSVSDHLRVPQRPPDGGLRGYLRGWGPMVGSCPLQGAPSGRPWDGYGWVGIVASRLPHERVVNGGHEGLSSRGSGVGGGVSTVLIPSVGSPPRVGSGDDGLAGIAALEDQLKPQL